MRNLEDAISAAGQHAAVIYTSSWYQLSEEKAAAVFAQLEIVAETLEDFAFPVGTYDRLRFDEFTKTPAVDTRLIVIDLRHHSFDVDHLRSVARALGQIKIVFLVLQKVPLQVRAQLQEIGEVRVFIHPLQSPKAVIRTCLHEITVSDECQLRRESLDALGKSVPAVPSGVRPLNILVVGAPSGKSLSLMSTLILRGFGVTAAISAPQCVQYLEARNFDGLIYVSGDNHEGFPGLLRLVRRRDKFKQIPAFLVRCASEGFEVSEKEYSLGADYIYSPGDDDTDISHEIEMVCTRYQLFNTKLRFLVGTKEGERRQVRPLCSRSFLELHLARHCIEAEKNNRPLALIMVQLEVVPQPSAGGWTDKAHSGKRVLREAAAYAGMLTEDTHLAGKLKDDQVLIVMPASHLGDADRLAQKIQDVLSQMAFRTDSTPNKLAIATSTVQHRAGEKMMALLARASEQLAQPKTVHTALPAQRSRKSIKPTLTIVE